MCRTDVRLGRQPDRLSFRIRIRIRGKRRSTLVIQTSPAEVARHNFTVCHLDL